MKPDRRGFLAGTAFAALSAVATDAFALADGGRSQAPNIILIVADDLGFADLGCFGGEIHTPHLDRLAATGARLSNFHVAAGCSPTRAMLLTGLDHHRVGFGTFAELSQDNQRGKPGYEGRLDPGVATISERLRRGGYRTLMSGKWHLGSDLGSDPSRRGFERSFALAGGGSNHFGRGPDGGRHFRETYREDGQTITQLPEEFYSSDFFTSRLIDFIAEDRERPFFAYLAFTAPHYPLQAPAEEILRYRGRYGSGWADLYRTRMARLTALGLVPEAKFDRARHAELARGWAALNPAQRVAAARMMEVYAAMVTRLDSNVGRLCDAIARRGDYGNTIFLFMSDNGPEGTELDKSERNGALGRAMLAGADNSLDAIGGPTSYVWYGPGWAHASAAPFSMFKHFPNEGGIRVPAIAVTPRCNGGEVKSAYAFVTDVVPTLLDWAGLPTLDLSPAQGYRGRSLSPYFAGVTDTVHAGPEDGWELWGRRAYRRGRWKAVLIPDAPQKRNWQLFDVISDPSESRDLAARHPAILRGLTRAWEAYARTNGVVLPSQPGL